MIYLDVDVAISELPVNALPLVDDTDFKTRETAIAYDESGMDLVWHFLTPAGVYTQTAVTPTTAGVHDWAHKGEAYFTIEMPASGGTVNNDTEGVGWWSGVCDGVLPWTSERFCFRAAGLNNLLIEDAFSATRGLAGTALPAAAADAAGGLVISDAGGLDIDALNTNVSDIEAQIGVAGAGLTDVPWNAAWDAEVQSECNDALVALGLDHLLSAAVVGADVADNSIFAQLVSKESTADWDDFANTTDALQALRDRGDAAWLTATGFSTHSAADVRSEMDSNSTRFAAIEGDTQDLQAQIGTAGAGLTNVPWNAAWDAEVQSECNDALVALGLDHLVSTSVAGADVADDSIIAQLVSKSGTADWDDYDNATDALQAQIDSRPSNFSSLSIDGNGRVDIGSWLGTAVTTSSTSAKPEVDVFSVYDSETAANNLSVHALTLIQCAVDNATFTATTTALETDSFTEATADHMIGRLIVWTSGVLQHQMTDITDYEQANSKGKFTYTALTDTPADNDTFLIV